MNNYCDTFKFEEIFWKPVVRIESRSKYFITTLTLLPHKRNLSFIIQYFNSTGVYKTLMEFRQTTTIVL